MNKSCSHKIARLLAVLICCALLAGCKGKEQEDVFPDIAHYTVPEQNSMRVTLYFPTEEPSAFSSEVRQVDLAFREKAERSCDRAAYERPTRQFAARLPGALQPKPCMDHRQRSLY